MKRSLYSMSLFILLVMAITLAPALPVYAQPTGPILNQDSTGPGDTWTAPSIIGLDWTSSAWTAKLPKYPELTGRQYGTLVSASEPAAPPPTAPTDVIAPSDINAPSQAPQNPGTLNVYGAFTTVLSNDGNNGADSGLVGIAWGDAHIYRCSDNAYLGGGLTNGYGSTVGQFSINVENPGASGFYVGIFPDTSAASVRTGSGGWDSYGTYVPSTCFYPNLEATSYGIGSWYMYAGSGGVYRGAWMIYESIVQDARNWGAWNLFANRLNPYGTVFGYLVIRFPYETWAHYHAGGEIHLPTMNDARSPDVIQHEYAHFAMYSTYGTWFNTYCPSPHYINGVSHVNCAYSEGWASWIPYATHRDKTYTYANNFNVDEENLNWDTGGWSDGPAVEGRVTAALIDFSDSENDGWDITGNWLLNIWWIFKYRAAPAVVVNYHDFMVKFKAQYAYKTPLVLTNWYNTIYYTDL